jgi:DNA-binding XRE family transcriptional regulator
MEQKRYIIQHSQDRANWWVLTDTKKGIVILFEEGKFNETQKITYLNDIEINPTTIAHDLRLMADWLAQNHYHLAVANTQQGFDREYHRKVVGDKLRQLRNSKNLTITDVAKATGIHATNISKIENGKYGFTIDAINQLLSVYGCDIDFVG